MDSKFLYNQGIERLHCMEEIAVKVEDDKMNFFIDGRLKFYIKEASEVMSM